MIGRPPNRTFLHPARIPIRTPDGIRIDRIVEYDPDYALHSFPQPVPEVRTAQDGHKVADLRGAADGKE